MLFWKRLFLYQGYSAFGLRSMAFGNGDYGVFIPKGWTLGRYDDEFLLVRHEHLRVVELVKKKGEQDNCQDFKNHCQGKMDWIGIVLGNHGL